MLAATLHARAPVIVTFNLRHFLRKTLAPWGVRAQAPDAFLEALMGANTPRFLSGLRRHRASLHNPSKTVEEYLSALAAQGLPEPGRNWKRIETRSEIGKPAVNRRVVRAPYAAPINWPARQRPAPS